MKKRDIEKLQAALRSQIADATGSTNSDISQSRSDLFDRYMGEPYGDEARGRSSVVMSDVMDTIEWIKPELLDIFTTGDKAAEFTPVGEEDVEAAEQETMAVNHVFYQMNNGFLVFYEWFTDALLQKNGYVRSDWDEREIVEIDELANVSAFELDEIIDEIEVEGGEVKVLEQEEGEARPVALDDGSEVVSEFFKSVKLKTVKKANRYKIEVIAPEDMEVSPRWDSISLEECPYSAHRSDRPVSWLVEMGFDRKQAERIQDANEDDTEEEISRFNVRGATEASDSGDADKTTREIVVREAYIRYDLDGDGRSELLKVWSGGTTGEVLKWDDGSLAVEEVESPPFSCLSPIIVPHRHVGVSVAELVDDLQKIRTVLARQMLDNVNMSNNATKIVSENGIGQHTISDLLSPQVGKVIREREPGAVRFEAPPNLVGASLQAMEFINGERENRSGVNRHNQGIDANSLNKTASGMNQLLSEGQKKILLIARVFAETGVQDLFRRIHSDLRRGPSKAMMIKMSGKYVEVDPREWRRRDDVTISVGLGTGNKDAQLGRIMALRQAQVEDAQFGLVGIEERARLNDKMTTLMGFKGSGFFKSPDQIQPQAPQEDPTQAAIAAQVQIEQAKLAQGQTKIAADMQKAQMEDDRKRDEVDVKARIELMKMPDEQLPSDADLLQVMNEPG